MNTSIKILTLLLIFQNSIYAQCPPTNDNIYTFLLGGITKYEIVKENLTWKEAANCAVSRGGKLVEINSKGEQDSINLFLKKANIIASNTTAPDGGGASYLWIGGNDLKSEGIWIWDGANTGAGKQFWLGTSNGFPINGLYSNWGNEPDDFMGQQDALALAITDWPLGVAGQWNDINELNKLYYIIEYPQKSSIEDTNINEFTLFPNPTNNQINVCINLTYIGTKYYIYDLLGIEVLSGEIKSEQVNIDISKLSLGNYFFQISSTEKQFFTKVF